MEDSVEIEDEIEQENEISQLFETPKNVVSISSFSVSHNNNVLTNTKVAPAFNSHQNIQQSYHTTNAISGLPQPVCLPNSYITNTQPKLYYIPHNINNVSYLNLQPNSSQYNTTPSTFTTQCYKNYVCTNTNQASSYTVPQIPSSYVYNTIPPIPVYTTSTQQSFTPYNMNISVEHTKQNSALPETQYNQLNNIREIISILPDFDPILNNALNSSQFIKRINRLKQMYMWDDRVLLFAVQTKLKGAAKIWIDNIDDVFSGWEDFVEKFLHDFPSTTNVADTHIEMMETKWYIREPFEDYYYKMLALGRKANLPESSVLKYLLNGITNAELKKSIAAINFENCNQLLCSVRRYVNINANNQKPTNMNSNTTKVKSTTSFQQTTNAAQDTKKENRKPQDTKSVICYNCFNTGHFAINCTQPQRRERCSICLRTTHTTENCREKSRMKPVNQPNTNKIEDNLTSDDESKTIRKCISVNGKDTICFVDSGSNRSLVRKTFAKSLGDEIQCNVILSGFAGGQYVCKNKILTTLVIDGRQFYTELLVVEDNFIRESILLGRDVLCRRGCRLIIEEDICRIENTEELNIEKNLLKTEKQQVKDLLNKYRKCIATNVHELGKCSTIKMNLKLKTDEIVSMKPYRLPFAKRPIVEKIIAELLDADIIRPSSSEFSSPIVLVDKKNNESRMCVDYRQLNKITVKQPFPMPNLEEQFVMLAGHKYYTTLDLKMGYHQIEIDEASKKYTAFVTHNGHYEYNRMPFGLVNAPSVFQKLMNQLISKMNVGEAIAYLDDITLPSKNVADGLEILEKFLKLLFEHGLTIRLDKCQFLSTEINYLGHIVNENGIRPGNEKLSAIENFKPPTNVTEVRRFLGLTGFFRKFVNNYAVIAEPICKLLRKSEQSNFVWAAEQQKSFDELIKILCEKPVLALFDFNAQLEIHTDASSVGLAGVLLQSKEGRNWNAVAYYSRHCSETERQYHSHELEVLAAVESLDRFRVYVLGKHIRLVTDCSAIATLKAKTEMNRRIARWFLRLLEYDFEAVHRPGTRLAHVDALSRAPELPPQEPVAAGLVFQIKTASDDWVYLMQLQDESLEKIIRILKSELKDDQEDQIKKEYILQNHRLYRRIGSESRFVVPKAVRWQIIKHCHDNFGHFGLENTINRIKQHYWFPKIRKHTKDYIASCTDCCYNKIKTGKVEGQLYINEIHPIPFYQLHLDHLGPFIRSKKGNMYILAISDAFSKYLVVKAVRNTKTLPVINVLKELTSYFGLPRRIITDRGTAFTSKLFETYCADNDIQHIKTAVRTPRSNGQVERANQTILSFLRTSSHNDRSWDENLYNLQWSVNSQKNKTTGFSPNEIIFDFKLKDIISNRLLAALQEEDMINTENLTSIQEKRAQALQNIQSQRLEWKARFDKKHLPPKIYNEHDLIVIQHEPSSTGESRKLEAKFKGPYIITKCLGKDRYLIEDIPGMQISTKKFCSVFTSDKIKPWCHSVPEFEDDNGQDSEGTEVDSSSGMAELSRT